MPTRTGGDQRERRADVRPANRLRQQPHGATVLQNLIGKGVHRRFGNPGVERGDDRHTLPPFFFIALPPVFGPMSRRAWSGEEPSRQSGGDAQLPLDVGHHRVRQARLAESCEVLSDDVLP